MTESFSSFERELQDALTPPDMDAAFRVRLASLLKDAAAPRRQRRNWRPAVAGGLILVMLLAILAIGPQRVWAQVVEWFSAYVPGIGFVETESGLRILEEPLSQTRDGVTISIQQGLIDDESTHLTILYEGIQPEMRPLSEADPGCYGPPELQLPDGTILTIRDGTGTGAVTWFQENLSYSALPTELDQATLLIGCLPDVQEDAAPEGWTFELRFVPAGEAFQVLPVVPVPTAEETESAAPHGMQLMVDEWVQLEDGHLFRGRFSWEGSPFRRVEFWLLELELVDARGQAVPIEVETDWRYVDSGDPYVTWTARSERSDLGGELTFSLSDFSIRRILENQATNSFSLDIGDSPQPGQVWTVNQTLEFEDKLALVKSVTYDTRPDGNHELLLDIQLLSEDILTLNIMDANNRSFSFSWSGTGFEAPGRRGQIGILYDYYPSGEHLFWVDNYFLTFSGPWTASLELPVSETPTERNEHVCLNADLYASAATEIPSDLQGRLLIQDFSGDTPLPSLFVAGLDGTTPEMIDSGAWATFSPDGRYVAYAHDGLRVVDLESGQPRLLIEEDIAYALAWSPGGSRLAFIIGARGPYLVNADGSNLRPMPGGTADMIAIAGWMPDGEGLVVSSIAPDGSQLQLVSLDTGEVSDQLLIEQRKGGFPRLSPDGEHIAYSQLSLGSPTYSIYLARLDGTEERLLAESSPEAAFSAGAWSVDGQWLILNTIDLNDPNVPYLSPVLLNVESCEAYLLESFQGEVVGWAP